MRKKILWILLAVFPFTLTACGSSSSTKTVFSDEDYGTVTLCDYKNLSAEKNIYTVTDEDIQTQIDMLLYDYAEYSASDGPSELGDSITADITISKNGETLFDYTGENYYEFYLGSGEFGGEFDKKLTGVSVGDTLSFDISYDKDYTLTELAGSTVTYNVSVLSITKETLPELTEDFIVNTLGYQSEDGMKKELRANLESDNEANSTYELREDLIQQVIDNSAFDSYSQDLYDSYAAGIEENYESYAEMFGCESVEEVYDLFEITEDDIEKEIINQVYRTIAVHAISDAENLSLSDKEYQEGLERYVEELEYENSDDLVADYGEDSLREWLLEDKVLALLEKNAKITEKEAVLDTEEL